MTSLERTRLETRIRTHVYYMKSGMNIGNWEMIFDNWFKVTYLASILRTEIDNKGDTYIDQKRRKARGELTNDERTKQKMLLCLQEIILAKQDRDLPKFRYWFSIFQNLIKFEPIIKARPIKETL